MSFYTRYKQRIDDIILRFPKKTAFRLFHEDCTLSDQTYSQLAEQIRDFRKVIDTYQLFPGDRVMIFDNNTLDSLRLLLCLSYYGITSAIVDTSLIQEETDFFSGFLKLSLVFTNTQMIRKLDTVTVPVLETTTLKELRGGEADSDRRSHNSTDDIAIILSSGTTSRMKAVRITYKSVLLSTSYLAKGFEMTARQPGIIVFPIFHVSGLISALTMFFRPNTIIMLERFDPQILTKAFHTLNPYSFGMVPKFFSIMRERFLSELEKKDEKTRKLYEITYRISNRLVRRNHRRLAAVIMRPFRTALFGKNMRTLAVGATPGDEKTVDFLLTLGLDWNYNYASTEAGVPIASALPKDTYPVDHVGKARGNKDVRIRIKDPDEFGVGEIQVDSQYVTSGYFRDGEMTRSSFDGSYFRTGDLGFIDRDGNLHITGRSKDMILLPSGKKVSPSDLEDELSTCTDRSLTVVPMTDRSLGYDRIHVFIEGQPDDLLKEKILSHAAHSCPLYPVTDLHFTEVFPRTNVGKIKKYILQDMICEDSSEDNAEPKGKVTIATNDLEKSMMSLLSDFFRKEVNGSQILLLDLPLDSLGLFELSSRIEQMTGVSITAHMKEITTVSSLVDLVRKLMEERS